MARASCPRCLDEAWGFRPTAANRSVLLCGNPDMIGDMCEALAGEGFRDHGREHSGELFLERYW